MRINEVTGRPYRVEWTKRPTFWRGTFETDNGLKYGITLADDQVTVDGQNYSVMDAGFAFEPDEGSDPVFGTEKFRQTQTAVDNRIIPTIIDAVVDRVRQDRPNFATFTPSDDRLEKVYDLLLQRFGPRMRYKKVDVTADTHLLQDEGISHKIDRETLSKIIEQL